MRKDIFRKRGRVCVQMATERDLPRRHPHGDIARTVESRAVTTEKEEANAFLGSF